MPANKKKLPILPNGKLDLPTWLNNIKKNNPEHTIIEKAVIFAETTSTGLTTFYGQPCLEQGLEIADILLELNLDEEAVAASIITSTLKHTKLHLDIAKEFNESIDKLVNGVLKMDLITTLNTKKDRSTLQTDRLRKTFLAMVSDIRVVLIKLATQTCILRGIKNINMAERQRIAEETLDIYAPLANRLGIGQLKWELEDLAFHYTNPDTYKAIASFLAERRIDRENRIHSIVLRLKDKFAKLKINASISGRAKHIYSIFLKMQKKHLDLKNIYDVSAVRVLVDKIEDCYTVLSIVHNAFDHVSQEFDDYIANPKPNGYRSIHTAIIDQEGKHLEIQIRTREMHNEAEHGVAAHWLYKEEKPKLSGYEAKITFLRQLLAWHKDVSTNDKNQIASNSQNENTSNTDKIIENIEDRVYAFTPAGDIIDLSIGATPLDFAYHIHSQIGHCCRGAKINGSIVPLTHTLRTGDRVEILTVQNGVPSRDWLNKDSGYLKTSRARAKVAQWFNQQEMEQYINTAKQTLDKEMDKAGITHIDLQKIATRLNFKNSQALLSSLGHGSLRVSQIIHAAQNEKHINETNIPLPHRKKNILPSHLEIAGVNDLLTRIALCCKPIPGDDIIGYITQGRGVSIHKRDCKNTSNKNNHDRLMAVNWDSKKMGSYYVDLQIHTQNRENLLKEMTALLANDKIDLINMNSTLNKKNHSLFIIMTVQIHNITQLQHLINQINQLPYVLH
ncbi:MAG: bifunctional (p)ppGpp synthetase/guanosine-3',5'-bis(diphosphate) 3'-pyrophosphohydrolase, partial [Gammaproteobacteria bacterium]|nr:bifunctional (p)ppGpp synthetase/guanosine-3',5'-bis(diphosphate) 3'-pyrophosphohydrolase [Gammaproteobacteria bacterium]